MQKLKTILQNLGRTLVSNDLVRAQLLAAIRHGLTICGTVLGSWGWVSNASTLGKVEDAIAGALVVVLTQYFSQSDVSGVAAKMKD